MDPRKLIKAEMAKRGIEKTKRMAAPVINKVKKTEAFVHHQLETPLWHYGIRIALVLLIILIKRIPDAWVMMSKNMVVRVLIAAVIVYLAYIDVFSAALMAVVFVLLVQESGARSAAHLLVSASVPAINNKEKLHLSVGMGQKPAGGDDSLIGLSSYGSPDEVINIAGPHDYVSQLGTLGITQDMAGGKLPLVVDAEEPGTKYFKTNMGQGMNSVVYDQPASKTLTENIQETQTGFITAKNLLDAQINGAQGADTEVPCAVESIHGSFNAQGLGIPMSFAHDSCMFSKVN
jgi:hypothetical protein